MNMTRGDEDKFVDKFSVLFVKQEAVYIYNSLSTVVFALIRFAQNSMFYLFWPLALVIPDDRLTFILKSEK